MDIKLLLRKLKQFENKIKKSNNEADYFKEISVFRKFCATFSCEKTYNSFLLHPTYNHFKLFFQTQNDVFLVSLEKKEANNIINTFNGHQYLLEDLISSNYFKQRYSRKTSELKAINFSNAETIIIVGFGPYPDTLMYISKNTNIKKIIGIDIEKEALVIANKLIKLLNLENIQLKLCNGTEYNYQNADIVYIEGMVSPKKHILDQIIKNCKNDIQILIDMPNLLQELLYDKVNIQDIPDKLKITDNTNSLSTFYNQNMIKLEIR